VFPLRAARERFQAAALKNKERCGRDPPFASSSPWGEGRKSERRKRETKRKESRPCLGVYISSCYQREETDRYEIERAMNILDRYSMDSR